MKKNYFVSYLKKYKGTFILSILFSILSVILSILPYLMIYRIITMLLDGVEELNHYLPRLGQLLLFFILSNLCHKISTSLSHGATFRLLGEIRYHLKEKLSRLPLGVIDDYGAGRLKDLLVEKVDAMETPFAHIIPEVTGNVLVCIGTFIYLIVLDWRLALAGFVVIPLSLLLYGLMQRNYQVRFQNYIEKNAILNNTIIEYIHGIEVIKAFNQSASAYEKLQKDVYNAAHGAIDWMRENVLGMAIAMVMIPSTLLVVIPLGAWFYLQGSLAFDTFILIMIVNFAVTLPLLQAISHTDNIAQMTVNTKIIEKILDERELERPEKLTKDLQDLTIIFSHVNFAYDETEVLHDVNMSFRQNQVHALVGPSGSGKSTITKLLTSFYDLEKGRITIGGVDLRDIPLTRLNQLISYVSQKDYLFNTTIMENLKMGDPNKSEEEIIEICKQCGVHEFISQLEEGYDTLVGSSGGHLSGGERQRITIARAMVKDAPIIIFDEATAYTDPENEALIQKSVSALVQGKTLIVIAHRLSTITDADEIFVIDEGRVRDHGSHEELLITSPLYQKMYQAHIQYRDEKVSL